jgi:hypothetical protein
MKDPNVKIFLYFAPPNRKSTFARAMVGKGRDARAV